MGAKPTQHTQTSAKPARAGNSPEALAYVLGAAAENCARAERVNSRWSSSQTQGSMSTSCTWTRPQLSRGDKSLRARTETAQFWARQQFYKICVSNRQKPAESIKQQTAKMSMYGAWVSSIKHQAANSKHVHPGRLERSVQRVTGWLWADACVTDDLEMCDLQHGCTLAMNSLETYACMSACMYLFSLVAPSFFNTFIIFQKLSTIVLNCSKLHIIVFNFT